MKAGRGAVLCLLAALLLLAGGCGWAGTARNPADTDPASGGNLQAVAEEARPVEERLTITAVGDLLMHLPLVRAAATDTGYDFRPLFAPVAPELQRGDITIANLETTLAGEAAGYSGYPLFNTPDALLDALMDSGVTMLTTANNHALDRGAAGLRRTLTVIREAGLDVTGTRLEPDEPPYAIVTAKGFRVAVLAYTYGTNGIPVPEPHLINLIDKETMARHIEQARAEEPDLLVVAMHWGQEYARQPNGEQRELAQFLHQLGVDAILGAHPHVVQPVEILWPEPGTSPYGRPTVVIYSMGNFVSNQQFPYTDTGIIVHLTYKKRRAGDEAAAVTLEEVAYRPVWVHRRLQGGLTRYQAVPTGGTPLAATALTAGDVQRLEQAHRETEDLLGPSPLYQRRLPLLAACTIAGPAHSDCPL